ncbi:MAG: TIGR04282 family arsenosugar biosynthesis glycosyltransferase, partial [Chthoniobacterales bacterium]
RFPRALRPLLSLGRLESDAIDADFHLFTNGPSEAPPTFHWHAQRGVTFAERLELALEEISDLGYEEIVVIGADCPGLTTTDITAAFAGLASKRLVLGPDHRGGCYLIGLRARDRYLLRGIAWNRDRDRAQLQARVAAEEIALLATRQDVDSWADVRLLARAGHLLAQFVVRAFGLENSARGVFVDLTAQDVRVRGQMPPPVIAR